MAQKPLDFDNPTTLTTTPSGVEIAYFDGKDPHPRRAYALRRNHAAMMVERGVATDAEDQWREVPSVTTILDVLEKGGLSWWGQGVGVTGVLALANERGLVRPASDGKLAVAVAGTWVYATQDNLVATLKEQKLTVNDTLSDAGDRGTAVHSALEAWAGFGKIPDPSQYPQDVMMYVEGLRKFCVDMGDAWETTGQEIAVGSVEHGFAGRYDLRGRVVKDVKLVTRAFTKKGDPLKRDSDRKYTIVPAGTSGLVDAKTSKGVYATHLMQLEGYEGGSIECGYDPTDWRAVLHISKHGLYEFKQAKATYGNFLSVLDVYRTLKSVEEVL